MSIDLTKPIEVRIETNDYYDWLFLLKDFSGRSNPMGGADKELAEAYRRLFEAAPKMLAWMKNQHELEELVKSGVRTYDVGTFNHNHEEMGHLIAEIESA